MKTVCNVNKINYNYYTQITFHCFKGFCKFELPDTMQFRTYLKCNNWKESTQLFWYLLFGLYQ